jgi:hypothetical protein
MLLSSYGNLTLIGFEKLATLKLVVELMNSDNNSEQLDLLV